MRYKTVRTISFVLSQSTRLTDDQALHYMQ